MRRNNTAEYIDALLQQLAVPETRAAAIDGLLAAFEPLVKALARGGPVLPTALRWVQRFEVEDLEQVARIGLLKACASFNSAKGAFPAHATWMIKSELANATRCGSRLVKITNALTLTLPRFQRIRRRLECDLQREPSLVELSAAVGLPEWKVLHLLANDYQLQVVDSSFTADGGTPEDALLEKEALEQMERK